MPADRSLFAFRLASSGTMRSVAASSPAASAFSAAASLSRKIRRCVQSVVVPGAGLTALDRRGATACKEPEGS